MWPKNVITQIYKSLYYFISALVCNCGAKTNIKALNQWTALDFAKNQNKTEAFDFLLEMSNQQNSVEISEEKKEILEKYHLNFNDDLIGNKIQLKSQFLRNFYLLFFWCFVINSKIIPWIFCIYSISILLVGIFTNWGLLNKVSQKLKYALNFTNI